MTGSVIPSSLKVPTDSGKVEVIDYSTLAGIESYITKDYRASSLKNADGSAYTGGGYYTVFLTKNATDAGAKIAIAIVAKNEDGTDLLKEKISGVTTTEVKVSYDGSLSDASNGGVAYVEP